MKKDIQRTQHESSLEDPDTHRMLSRKSCNFWNKYLQANAIAEAMETKTIQIRKANGSIDINNLPENDNLKMEQIMENQQYQHFDSV